jgi:FkbM family methyltransferase
MLHFIPGWFLEKVYYSKFGKILCPIYDYFAKNQTPKPYLIHDNILVEVDLSKPAERAIPFDAYEPKVTEYFLAIVKEGDIVFDVGAWIGYYVLLAAKKAKHVIAIEADDKNCQRISRNIQLNGFSNVTVINAAAGEKSSYALLIQGAGSSMHKVYEIGSNRIGTTIKTEPLDDIISNMKIGEINILIMDIEGYEYFALKGLQNSLRSHIVKNIICEIHPSMLKEHGLSKVDVLNLFYKYGYSVNDLQKGVTSHPYHIHAKIPDLHTSS